MSTEIKAVQGETVESICYRHYGYTANITSQVYDINPGLAALGVALPIGTTIILPDVAVKNEIKINNLWD